MSVLTYIPYGADGIVVRVEADIRRGIPGTDITGLADGAVREARERVRAAFRNSDLQFPADRILVNLAPAGVRKIGAALDLPIALSILAAAAMIPSPDSLMALGELELSGRVRPVHGVLAAVAAGLKAGIEGFMVPLGNRREAAILAGDRIAAVGSLSEAVHILRRWSRGDRFPDSPPDPPDPREIASDGSAERPECGFEGREAGDFREASGHERYKRALEIAAAGGHNLLAFGPPGCGKTMLARRLPSIMPRLSPEEAVEATRLHSLAGRLRAGDGLIDQPPFRSPHHSASAEGILGGGRTPRPGEISLAHNGVLFMDEAPEFRVDVLRALREPLEDGVVSLARAEGSLRLPADFQLILAANPCPCGRLGLVPGACLCSAEETARHWRRLGAALLDRVELRVPVLPPSIADFGRPPPESSATVAVRVARAIARQRERYRFLPVRRNARLPPALVDRFCVLDRASAAVLTKAAERLGLSGRARVAVLKVALTIADLAGDDRLTLDYLMEAIQHRRYGDDPYDIAAVAVSAPGPSGSGDSGMPSR